MKLAIAACAAAIACAAIAPAHAAESQCDIAPVRLDQIQVQQANLSTTPLPDEALGVVTLATIRNDSDRAVDDLQVEVKYFNAQHEHIDTLTDTLFVEVPAHGEIGIRVRGLAAKPATAYASQEVRLVSAQVARHCGAGSKPAKSNWFVDLLLSWGPMLLLILVWVWFMRSKRMPNNRIVELYEKQVSLVAQQNELLSRLADSSERLVPPRDTKT